jgi:hypothetical protein
MATRICYVCSKEKDFKSYLKSALSNVRIVSLERKYKHWIAGTVA